MRICGFNTFVDFAEEFEEKAEVIDLALHLQHYLPLSHLLQAHPLANRHLGTTQSVLRPLLSLLFIVLLHFSPHLQAISVPGIGFAHIDWLCFIGRSGDEVLTFVDEFAYTAIVLITRGMLTPLSLFFLLTFLQIIGNVLVRTRLRNLCLASLFLS